MDAKQSSRRGSRTRVQGRSVADVDQAHAMHGFGPTSSTRRRGL